MNTMIKLLEQLQASISEEQERLQAKGAKSGKLKPEQLARLSAAVDTAVRQWDRKPE